MPLEIYQPQSYLKHYVSMMWHWDEYNPSHSKELILPIGMMELTFNLADNTFCIENTHDQAIQTIRGGMIVGAQSKPFITHTHTSMDLLSVLFNFGGALEFFNVAGKTFHNQHITLDDVWGKQATQDLYEKLCTVNTSQARFHILEETLLKQLNQNRQRHQIVDYALNKINNYPQLQRIKQITEEIGISSTRFIQLFKDDLGMTPKQFHRVRRFHHTLNTITSHQTQNWAEIALCCGYYDQAHFNNEFRHFTGITPSAYAPQNIAHNTNLAITS